jgi:hypothetical protein
MTSEQAAELDDVRAPVAAELACPHSPGDAGVRRPGRLGGTQAGGNRAGAQS